MSSDGDLSKEVLCRIAKAARIFGCLKEPIFRSKHLSLETKRAVYRAVVLSTLLYGAETWTIKAAHVADDWYEVAQNRQKWLQVCTDGARSAVKQHQQQEEHSTNITSASDNFTCPCG